jgi:hypothetical protein
VAYEALLRTDDTVLSRPTDILAAAEKLGRVAEVGRAVRAWAAMVCSGAPQPPRQQALHLPRTTALPGRPRGVPVVRTGRRGSAAARAVNPPEYVAPIRGPALR